MTARTVLKKDNTDDSNDERLTLHTAALGELKKYCSADRTEKRLTLYMTALK